MNLKFHIPKNSNFLYSTQVYKSLCWLDFENSLKERKPAKTLTTSFWTNWGHHQDIFFPPQAKERESKWIDLQAFAKVSDDEISSSSEELGVNFSPLQHYVAKLAF